jgi:hypothetical protein
MIKKNFLTRVRSRNLNEATNKGTAALKTEAHLRPGKPHLWGL